MLLAGQVRHYDSVLVQPASQSVNTITKYRNIEMHRKETLLNNIKQ